MKKILYLLVIFYSMGLNADYYKGNNGEYYYFLEACVKHKENNKEVLLSLPTALIKYGVMDFQHLNSIVEDSLCSFYFEGNEKLINIENPHFSDKEDKFYFYKKNFNNNEKVIDILIAYDENSYILEDVKLRVNEDLKKLNEHLMDSGVSNIEVKSFEIFSVGDKSQEGNPLTNRKNTQCFKEEFRDINDGYGRHKETLNKMLEVGADILVYYRKEKECYSAEKGDYVLNSGLANISGYESNRKLRDSDLNFKTALVAMEESKASKYTFSHEIGHIFGLQHDIVTTPDYEGFFPFARGYGETDGGLISEYFDPNDQFYTIMGYAGSYDVNITTEGDERVNQSSPYFSTPNISLCGMERDRQCGKGKYHSTRSDAVSTLKITLPLIADIRSLTGKTLRKTTSGDDEITGTPENDAIDSGYGNDIIYKSSGEDAFDFSKGNNLFVFNDRKGGSDIVGFGSGDKILFENIDNFINEKRGNDLYIEKDGSILVLTNFYNDFTNYKIKTENGKKYLIPVNFDPQTDSGLHLDNETICIDYLSQDLTVTGTGTLCLEDYVSNLNVSFETGNVLLKGNNQLNNMVAKRTVLKPKSSNSAFYTYLPYQVSGDLILEVPNDSSVYSVLNSTIRGNLEIKQGVYLTTLNKNENKNHELKVYGKIINDGDFNTFSRIKNLYDAAPLNLYLHDRFLDSETAVNTSFGSGSKGLDRIKGNIYVKSKYPFRNKNYEDVYSLHSLETFKENDVIEVSSNQIIDSYKKAETKFQVNSGNRLIINNYDAGSFNLIKGSQLLINNFNSDANAINIKGEGAVAFNGSENELNNNFTSEDDTIYGSESPDLIITDTTENTVKSGGDNDMVYSKGVDKIYLGEGNDSFYNSIEKQSVLYVYENEGTEEIHTCSFSENPITTDCGYDFNEYSTQKIVINYNRDESIENYYKDNNDLVLEIGAKNKFIFKDVFIEERIKYDITYQDGSSMNWNQLKSLADIPEENRNVLKDGDYFEIFDEAGNGVFYVPEDAVVTFGEYYSGDVVNNGTIITDSIEYGLNMSGNGLLEIKSTSGMQNVTFEDGEILLSGYYSGGPNVSAKKIILDYIHKHPNGIKYQYIYGSLTGDVIIKNSLNDNDYSVLGNLVTKGNLTIDSNVILTTSKYSYYSKSQGLKIYGKIINNGEFNNIDSIDGIRRKTLNIELHDYIIDNVVIEKAYFNNGAFDKINENLYIYSSNIYDYDLSDLDIFSSFDNGTNQINVNEDLTLANYSDRETVFNVKSGSTLTLKSYVGGNFDIEDGAKVVVEDFGRYPQPLDITGSGVLEIKDTGGMRDVSFENGEVLLSGYNASGTIKAKSIILDYINKHVNGISYQSIGGSLEGEVIVRKSLNDSGYRVFSNLTIRESLTIEENVLVTTHKSYRSNSQTMRIYGKFINNGEFNNIDRIDNLYRRDSNTVLYDYIVDGNLVQKAYFNDGAFDKIKGNISIHSTDIYDYDLSNLSIFSYFDNGKDQINIDEDLTLANYGDRETTFNVKNGSTLTLKSYEGGKFNIESGSKVIIEDFGRYPQLLDVNGSGFLEIKDTGGMSSVDFLNGTVLLSGYSASGSVKAKTIIVDYLHKHVNDIGYQYVGGVLEGDVILRNSLIDSDYRTLSNLTVKGSLTIEENVFVTSNGNSYSSNSQNLRIYGEFINNGEFNNIGIIDGKRRKSIKITLYDYFIDGILVKKGFFNNGAFDKINGELSINSTNIYDYDLSDVKIFNSFENGTNEIIIDKDLSLAHYKESSTTFNIKSGSDLTIKSYVRGKFVVEEGAKIVVEGFGSYAETLDVSGNGVLEIKNMGDRESVNFPNGKVILGANAGRASVKAKTIILDYIHKIEGRDFQSISGTLEGDVIVRNSSGDSDYGVFGELTVKGSLTIEENVLVTTNETSTYYKSQTMTIYGRFINNGEFNNIDLIGGERRRELILNFYDYIVNEEVVQKAYFNDNAFDNIKGNLSIYSTNIYDYDLSDLDIFNYFENGTNEVVVDKNLILAHYKGSATTFNIKSGATLTIKSYVRGKFVVEEGAKLVVEGFGSYAGTLDISGSGILEVKNMGDRESINFPSGEVILGANAGRTSVKAKTIVLDYIHKIEGRDYQSISGTLEGDVIARNSLGDSDYIVFGDLTIKGSLTIEENVLVTTNETSTYYNSQTMTIYGKFINNGEFNNIDLISGERRKELTLSFYDYIINEEVVQKAYFNNGALDKIKGNLLIYSTNIYDYNLSNINILKSFNNGTDSLVIDKDYIIGSYFSDDQSIVVKSGATLRIKSYIAGDFTIENGAKVIIDSFGPYSRDLNISGSGIIEIRNSQGLDRFDFPNGTVLFSGYSAGSRYHVTAKNIEFHKLYDDQNYQFVRSRVLNGNVVFKNSQFNDYVYFSYQNFKVNGILTIENNVLFSIGRSDYQNLEVNGLLNNNGLITDKILIRGSYKGRLTIKLNDYSEKGIYADLNELGNHDISGDIWVNGTKIED